MKVFSFHINSCFLSEEGYYPFGMTMSAISSTAGTELNETFDINYYETYFRQYDAQLGRFTGVDALAEQTFSWSTYQFGYNNPVVFNDPTGLFADYSGYQWLPETFKTSRRNAYLNNGYIDIITGNENSADAQYFLQEHFSYIFGGEGTFNTNFNHFRFGWNSKGQMGYWLPFIGKSDRMMGDLREVVVGVKFEVYVDEGGEGNGFNTDMVDKIAGAIGVNMDAKEGLIELAKKSGDIGKSGEKYLSFTKAAGKMMGVTGAVTSWMDFNKNPSTGALVKAFVNTGLVFLRVNPFVGVGLGILDLTGGSDWFYNQVGNGIDNMGGPRR